MTDGKSTISSKGEVMTAEEAEQAGFTVDRHCYPWVAYKGPRFAPTETAPVKTPAAP